MGKPSRRRQRERYQRQHPEQGAARLAVWLAICTGLLKKPKTCSACGAGGVITGHHLDYAYLLRVVWLCVPCHEALHRPVSSK